MKRREFITLLCGAAGWPLTARAQSPSKVPIIGYLGAGTAAGQGDWATAFVQRLRELGWIEGRTIAIEYRWAENRTERYAEIAAEFVRLKVDVIATLGIAVPAVKRVTSVIPIIFAVDADPVGGGLVASLARPGGNVTGLSSQSPETSNDCSSCRRWFPACAAWQSLPMSIGAALCRRWMRFRRWLPRLVSMSSTSSNSAARTTSRQPSPESRAGHRPFTCPATRSWPPIGFASSPWRSPLDCRRASCAETTSHRVA